MLELHVNGCSVMSSVGRAQVNGHSSSSSRSSRREKRPQRDADRGSSQGSDREEEETGGRGVLRRKTARAAANKIKLLEVLD